jgi:hypothetical protein
MEGRTVSDTEMVVFLAEKAMGWKTSEFWWAIPEGMYVAVGGRRPGKIWNPLISIADAWMVVERMREKRFSPTFQWPSNRALFSASFLGLNGEYACEWDAEAPRAICLAAVKALEARQ